MSLPWTRSARPGPHEGTPHPERGRRRTARPAGPVADTSAVRVPWHTGEPSASRVRTPERGRRSTTRGGGARAVPSRFPQTAICPSCRRFGAQQPEPDRGDLAFLDPNEEPSGHPEGLCTFRAHLSGLFALTHTGVPSEVFRREIRQGYRVCRLARSLGGLGFRLPTARGSRVGWRCRMRVGGKHCGS